MRTTSPDFARWGGLALMLGALMFMLTKTRGYVDPDDSLLGLFMFVGFALWLAGLAALYFRYGPRTGRLGKVGLGMSVVGMVLLAVGHPFSFITGPDLFLLVVLGLFAMILGVFLFGIVVLRAKVLPRYWSALPLATGLLGFAWIFFTNSEDRPVLFYGHEDPVRSRLGALGLRAALGQGTDRRGFGRGRSWSDRAALKRTCSARRPHDVAHGVKKNAKAAMM